MKREIVRHTFLLSLGSNSDSKRNLKRLLEVMRSWWKDIKVSPTLTNKAVDMAEGTPDFTNQLVRVTTSMSMEEVSRMTKLAEALCGDDRDKRASGMIVADADILMCDETKYHQKDWERDYFKYLIKQDFTRIVLLILVCLSSLPSFADKTTSISKVSNPGVVAIVNNDVDNSISSETSGRNTQTRPKVDEKDILARAIEYFSGQKYHEALLLFEKLEKTRKLSMRMLAYKGVCQYKEGDYRNAITSLSSSLQEIEYYSPHERAVYYYSLGESHFQLGQYKETIPYFIKALEVCNDNDHAEVCYRLGFSEMMQENYKDAIKWYEEAMEWYPKADAIPSTKAHQEQTRRMLTGLKHQ